MTRRVPVQLAACICAQAIAWGCASASQAPSLAPTLAPTPSCHDSTTWRDSAYGGDGTDSCASLHVSYCTLGAASLTDAAYHYRMAFRTNCAQKCGACAKPWLDGGNATSVAPAAIKRSGYRGPEYLLSPSATFAMLAAIVCASCLAAVFCVAQRHHSSKMFALEAFGLKGAFVREHPSSRTLVLAGATSHLHGRSHATDKAVFHEHSLLRSHLSFMHHDFATEEAPTTLRVGSCGSRYVRVDDTGELHPRGTVLVQDNANIEERFQGESRVQTAAKCLFRRVPALNGNPRSVSLEMRRGDRLCFLCADAQHKRVVCSAPDNVQAPSQAFRDSATWLVREWKGSKLGLGLGLFPSLSAMRRPKVHAALDGAHDNPQAADARDGSLSVSETSLQASLKYVTPGGAHAEQGHAVEGLEAGQGACSAAEEEERLQREKMPSY